jgi:hypothetical protein
MKEQRRIQAEKEAEEKKRQAELARLAKEAEKKGLAETAQSIRIAAERPLIVPEAKATFKEQEGVSMRANWKYRVVDLKKLPREWMMPDDKKLAAFARGTQGGNPIPGVQFYNDPILSVKAKQI